MSDRFKDVREKTLEEFSKLIDDEISVVSPPVKANFLDSKRYSEIWEVKTGLYDDDDSRWLIENLTIYIAFPSSFPLVPSKIYYDKDDFAKIGYVPHTSILKNDVCVYDEFVIVDETNPSGIIYDQYTKAKKTLTEGIKGDNKEHFREEFIAYWETSSNFKDKLLKEPSFSVIEEEPENNQLGILCYSFNTSAKSDYDGIIFYNKNEEYIESYKKYFEEYKIYTKELEAFYVSDINIPSKPPFAINCGKSLELIGDELQAQFKKYFKSNVLRFVVFKKVLDNQTYYLGWHYPKPNLKMNGYRKSSLDDFSVTFKKSLPGHKKYVIRFAAERLNEERLINRSASTKFKQSQHKFLIAGIGSVGSHFTALINSLNNPELTLIDNDDLGSENIKRHFLGFKDLGCNKANAMKKFIKDKLPSQSVTAINDSFFDYYNKIGEEINANDYLFICLGKLNLDKWIINELLSGNIKKPVFILWVEPYLIGGQLLYLHPSDVPSIDDLFTDLYKYEYSIIDPNEFESKRDLFTLKEMGCQSTYSPYSSTHLSIYLTSVFSQVTSIIEDKSENTQLYSWVGDTSIANELDVKLRRDNLKKYSLIKNEL